MNMIGTIGRRAIAGISSLSRLCAVVWAILSQSVLPRRWPRTIRAVFARQILFTGVEALPFVSLVALLTGVSVVAQAQLWLGRAGRTGLLGDILAAVVIRELAPLLVNLVVIGRSGAAIAVELATMKVMGEIRVMEAQGLDPLLYLAMPRALAAAVSVFCLAVWFVAVAFVGGYASMILFGVAAAAPPVFLGAVLRGLRPADVGNVLAKTFFPGLFTAAICVVEGLRAAGAVTEVPQAATRAVVRSIAALFIISAIVSVLTYI
jgi:phospholipid/cholesterol/gamma-HCH transport system permease protein